MYRIPWIAVAPIWPKPSRIRTMRAAIALSLLGMATACIQPFEWQEADTVVSGVHVIDPADGAVRRDHMVVIRDGEVLAIVPSAGQRLPQGVQQIEGGGAYATPGLWDAHVHAFGDVDIALERTLPAFIAYGVTHIRDMGANFDRLRDVRAVLAAEPDRLAPRIVASGPMLVERELQWYGDLQRAIGEPGMAETAIAELDAGGVDFIKTYSGLSAASYSALMSAATGAGLPVDGHVPHSMGIAGVIEAGQRTIEHLDLSSFLTCRGGPQGPFGDFLTVQFGQGIAAYIQLAGDFWSDLDWSECGQALDAFAARGGALTPTLSMEVRDRARVSAEAIDQLDPGGREWCEKGLASLDGVDPQSLTTYYLNLFAALRSLGERGVILMAGTDTPNHCIAPGSSLAGELERLFEAGLSPLTVLQSATANPRRVLGLESAGLEPGQRADFVLFAANPLDDVTTYRAPIGLYTQGRWLDRDTLRKMRAELVVSDDKKGSRDSD